MSALVFHHNEVQKKVVSKLIQQKTFGNVFLASKIPTFPRPDFIFIPRGKTPKEPLAFELKPPHAPKREFFTGIGQAASYLCDFPQSYIVIPEQKIDGIFIPDFVKSIVDSSQTQIGILSYDIQTYSPQIIVPAPKIKPKAPTISPKTLEKSRVWAFWMDTNLEETFRLLEIAHDLEQKRQPSKNDSLDILWNNVLSNRYSTPNTSSYKLNYRLFFDHMQFWANDGSLTETGKRLYHIGTTYGWDSNEYRDALSYLLLTEGGYLELFLLVNEIQSTHDFQNRGNEGTLTKEIRELRKKHRRDS